MSTITDILGIVLIAVHFFIDFLLETVLNFLLGPAQKCPPLIKNKFITKAAIEIAADIRENKLSTYDVVKAYIDRLIEVNKVLNAVIDGPYLEALDEAREIDDRIKNGTISADEFKAKPFLGVPFTTKDSTAVKSKLYSFGILSRRSETAKEDAECIRLLREAGAIIVAKTSIPEVNLWQETRNNLIGNTKNPYDTRRTTGGSSGGEASLISSCGTCFGIGTDIGGSIRMPAYYCGIYGHKGTVGACDTRGVTDRTGKEKQTMVVVGPMTRSARDLLPLFKVLAGPETSKELKLDTSVDLSQLKFYYMYDNQDPRCLPVSTEIKNSIQKVVKHLSTISKHPVKEVRIKHARYTSKLWRYWMTQEPAVFAKLLGNGKELNVYHELLKKLVGQSEFTWGAIYSLVNNMILPKPNEESARELTQNLERELEEILGNDGVLLYPSYPRTAPFHYAPLIQIYNFAYWCIWNVLKVPATQVPLGLSLGGMPLGLQVVASKNRDLHCMKVAEEIEKGLGGWVPPFTSD